MRIPYTVDVDCPRCSDKITCSLKIVGKAKGDKGMEAVLSVPDLASQMLSHYNARH